MALYKILRSGFSCHGGKYMWSLPTKDYYNEWIPGEWTDPIPDFLPLELCATGYHLTNERHLLKWLNQQIFRAEGRGFDRAYSASDKTVCRQARLLEPIEKWNRSTALKFMVWDIRKSYGMYLDPKMFTLADQLEGLLIHVEQAADRKISDEVMYTNLKAVGRTDIVRRMVDTVGSYTISAAIECLFAYEYWQSVHDIADGSLAYYMNTRNTTEEDAEAHHESQIFMFNQLLSIY